MKPLFGFNKNQPHFQHDMLKKIKRKLKRILLVSSGQVSHLKVRIKCKSRWYGNHYGGFYACPELIKKDSVVYSFGVGEDVSFDRAIIDAHECTVLGFDPTPKSIAWIKNQSLPTSYSFFNVGIGPQTELTTFYLPINQEFVSGSAVLQKNVSKTEKVEVQMKSLSDIIREQGHKQVDVLKMDIEGSEYEIVESIISSPVPINQVLIEFHDRFFNTPVPRSVEAIKALRENGYEIFAIADSYEEISLVRKDALSAIS